MIWTAALGLTLSLMLGDAHAAEAPPRAECEFTYDAAAQASVRSLLRSRFGDVSMDFDLRHPAGLLLLDQDDVVETARGRARVDIGRLSWLGFGRSGPSRVRVPWYVFVAFDPCTGRAVGFQPDWHMSAEDAIPRPPRRHR